MTHIPIDGGPHSAMNIKTYVNLLESCSSGEILAPDRHEEDSRSIAIRLLQDEGLVFISEHERFSVVTITPKGAMALIEWKEFVEKRTIKHKLASEASKLFWMIVGATIISAKDIIQWLTHITSR